MKKVITILILTGALPALQAQTNLPARSLSLQDCITEALQHNFDVQVARYNPEINAYNLAATYGGYDPIFNLSGQHAYSATPSSLTENQLVYPSSEANVDSFNSGLTGVLPWGLQYDISGNVSENKGIAYSGGYTNNYQNADGSISIQLTQPLLKNFWIDSTRLQIKVARNNLKYSEALAQTQLDQDQQRMQIGTLAQLSVEQDQSQVAQNRANVITAEFTLVSDENALKSLITDNYPQWHDVKLVPSESLEATKQEYDLQESWNEGMTLRPDLLQAQITLEQQGIQLKFDRNQLYPQLNLTGSYGYNGAGTVYNDVFSQYRNQDSPFFSYGASLSIPLANVQPRNALKSDKVTERQDLLKLKQIEQNILVDIDNAVKQAQSDYESVEATRQSRIYAEAALDAEQKTYAVGKATTFEVLTYQNNLTTARGQEIRALANYEEALSNLAQQEGSTLQRRDIDLLIK